MAFCAEGWFISFYVFEYRIYGVPAVESLLFWISLSDMGSHFKNTVMKQLTDCHNIQHNIVLAGCSWVVGAIERLNREVLATARVMLSEFQLSHTEWPCLVRIMQSALSPQEVFTGLTPTSPLNQILLPNLTPVDHESVKWFEKYN